MPKPRLLRCGKCQVVMNLGHYVSVHRKGRSLACPEVPCAVCEAPLGRDAQTAFGDAVCSTGCAENHPGKRAGREARVAVSEELAALDRAEVLPQVYRRDRRAS